MNIPVERMARLPVYPVAELAAIERRMLADGRDVIDLSVGDAELPPPDVAVDALHRAAAEPRMSRYGFQMGLVAYREAIARIGRTLERMGVVGARA